MVVTARAVVVNIQAVPHKARQAGANDARGKN